MDGEVDGEGEGQDIGRRKGRTWGIDKRREGEVDGPLLSGCGYGRTERIDGPVSLTACPEENHWISLYIFAGRGLGTLPFGRQ